MVQLEEHIMARPRSNKTKKYPQGFYEKKRNGVLIGYIFNRVDGSTKFFSIKDFKRAKSMAHSYNRVHRVDPELQHEIIYKDVKEAKKIKRQNKALGYYLPNIFNRVCDEMEWKNSTLQTRTQQYKNILQYFSSIKCAELSLDDVNEFLSQFDSANCKELYNRYLYLLNKLLCMCLDQGVIEDNPAKNKKRKTIKSLVFHERKRLTLEDFKAIHREAGNNGVLWLQIAMELALQTCHGVNEIAHLKYDDIDDLHLKIVRSKNEQNPASRVKIPLNSEIDRIVTKSKSDNVYSPFVVHRLRDKRYLNRELGKGITHHTQIHKTDISRKFSEYRDKLGIQSDIAKPKRSGFHDIRALAIHLLDSKGIESKIRAAHADDKSNRLYKEGHSIWNIAEDVVIDWRS